MTSHSGEFEGPIVVTGPNSDALQDFKKTLNELIPQVGDKQLQVRLGKELFEANFSYSKCFLVMPRGDRTLVCVEGDRSSMYQELKQLCECTTGKWDVKRVFIVLYRNEDTKQELYDSKVSLLWDPGPQKKLKDFADVNHVISFKKVLNSKQKEALKTFIGFKKPIVRQPTSTESTNDKRTTLSNDQQKTSEVTTQKNVFEISTVSDQEKIFHWCFMPPQ
ncbi:uncharacterized protein LOC134183648 isoform X2 [Corticium candelabrum]|uniref:uncharacterized protein LOC134183648 isoform X2 n=1 Tax=Corticium candelabrum TaxID=121492 RepID=UPI002E25CB4F|nr:uncharacterized protein LOC134183648 isoform X2 [Corticium candelabrum]